MKFEKYLALILVTLFLCNAFADGLTHESENGGTYKYAYRAFDSNQNDLNAKHKIQKYCHSDYKVLDMELVHYGTFYAVYNRPFGAEKGYKKYYLVRFECLKNSVASNE